ncbi:BLUF domain-containing protein [Phenylobacterium sp.]|jgi:hypothetical protein|uniref:BLUF domain-containing protein n=1 Tax=Phenylobacterium sp. TaxID=1871053 RepID=UPI002E34A092|nr:BLUF domain-containing protein [Phenylobacterium sp.]HEX3366476.1 BLUF domain-containing protein [Phenylobacterium sp.]
MLRSVFFVSVKSTPWPHDGSDMKAIGEIARARNASLGITGALISTEDHFAGILEGPPPAIDAVMASIFRDARHWRVTVLEEVDLAERLFDRWSLAFAGRASLVDLRVTPRLLSVPADPADVRHLKELIRAFAGAL